MRSPDGVVDIGGGCGEPRGRRSMCSRRGDRRWHKEFCHAIVNFKVEGVEL
jgi:hypothetical protein